MVYIGGSVAHYLIWRYVSTHSFYSVAQVIIEVYMIDPTEWICNKEDTYASLSPEEKKR